MRPCPTRLFSHLRGGIIIALMLAAPATAHAASINFAHTDFWTSTVNVNTSCDFCGLTVASPAGAPALPADATFTLAPDVDPNSVNYSLALWQGKFWRYTFDLPDGYENLTFLLELVVNDEFVVYLNDTVIAMQIHTDAANFFAPLPGLSMAADGTASALGGGKVDYFLAALGPVFQVGTNELTIYGVDSCCVGFVGRAGAIGTPSGGTITYDLADATVPEPGALLLVLTGLAGLVVARRRRA